MLENRKHIRVNLVEHPQVYDAHSNKLLGRIVDISVGGFKMVTFNEMEEGKEYLLNILLPEKNNDKKFVEIKASVRWCSKETKPELITTGCHLVQIDALGRLDLAKIMLKRPKP